LDINFKNRKMEKLFNEGKMLEKEHGTKRARKIRVRLAALRAAESLMDFWPPKSPPERCHELRGHGINKFSMDLDHPYRLIFISDNDPVPLKKDGGLDWSRITAIKILGVENTHE
jgi:proteic killer suppression protein